MKKSINYVNDYELIDIEFKNRQDLIEYLKNAKTSLLFRRYYKNKPVQSLDISDNSTNFTGTKTFEEALELFENGWYEDFENFLILKKQVEKKFPYISRKKEFCNSVFGSVPNVVNAINNLPLNMRRTYNNNLNKIISINYNISYPWFYTKLDIYLNGLLTLATIDLLESMGYMIKLNFYDLIRAGNQILKITTTLKQDGEKINLQKVYFAFCNPSFVRRLMFRVTDTTNELRDDSNVWTERYGFVTRIDKKLNVDNNSIYVCSADLNFKKFIMDNIVIGMSNSFDKEILNKFDDLKLETFIEYYFKTISLNEYIEIDNEKYSYTNLNKMLTKK